MDPKQIDAHEVKKQGRAPVLIAEHGPWTIEVYRVGAKHEYQALAIPAGDPIDTLQGPRVGGPDAMREAAARMREMVKGAWEHRR